uniref:Uncharacterized protein LOC113799722 n=1 Tax=Dermatophagoides pteronyssinus TaxID=6956 RepID=A0A6P6YLX8_DERPT|nr:uncharacterized protein LOC113799722 [Dermatophagoides pteronyssinus]
MEQTDPLLWNHFRKNMAWLFGYTAVIFGYGIYQAFDTKNIKAFQTYILFTIETKDNFSIEELYEKNPMKYSRSTAIFFIYQECKIGLNLANFRKLFIQIQWCTININFIGHIIVLYIELNPNQFDSHPLWHYLLRFIFLNLQKSFPFILIYQRLIIFTEECQKYYSKLFLIGIMCTILSSQIIWKTLRFIRNDNYIIIILYYLLAIDYIIIIILSFTVSLFNKHLNSIRYDLQQTVRLMNSSSSSSFRNKFQMLMYYERLVQRRKLWGVKIGAITIMTTATFFKLMLANARFTMLSNKLF